MNTGERIIELLKEKNIRLIDFADLLGVYAENIEEWTRGNQNPTLGQIVKISEYLSVSCDFLLKGEQPENITVKCPHCGKKINLNIP